jgi:hypothetical protein
VLGAHALGEAGMSKALQPWQTGPRLPMNRGRTTILVACSKCVGERPAARTNGPDADLIHGRRIGP